MKLSDQWQGSVYESTQGNQRLVRTREEDGMQRMVWGGGWYEEEDSMRKMVWGGGWYGEEDGMRRRTV